jgi:hypothetical protein
MESLIAGHLGVGGPAQARAAGKVDLGAGAGRDIQGGFVEDCARGVEEPGLAPGWPVSTPSRYRCAHDQETMAVALQPGEGGRAAGGVKVVEAVRGDDGNSKAEGKNEQREDESHHRQPPTAAANGGLTNLHECTGSYYYIGIDRNSKMTPGRSRVILLSATDASRS